MLSSRESEVSHVFLLSILHGVRDPCASRYLPRCGSVESSLWKSREKGMCPGFILRGMKREDVFLESRWLLEAAHIPPLGVIAGNIRG